MGFVVLDGVGLIDASEILTAAPSDCLVGYSAIFANSNGEVQQGTMINATGSSKTYTCNETSQQKYKVSAGYHAGTEQISVNPIGKTTSQRTDFILKGKKAYVCNGNGSISLVTGTAGR